MSEQPVQHYIEDDDLTLKGLILKVKEFWKELWRCWWIIALITIPIFAYMVYKAVNSEVVYPTKLTFMVEEDSGGGLGALGGLAASFGLGGGGGGEYNLEKMLELARSRKLIQTVLFDKDNIHGKEDYFANHLIRIYNYHDGWSEDTTGLKNFLFVHDSIPGFEYHENNALKQLHRLLVGDREKGVEGLISSSISESTGIMTLSISTLDERLSLQLLEDLYEKLSKYYVEKSIEKASHTFNTMKFKTDSIYTELRNAEYSLANIKDTQKGLFKRTDQLKGFRLEAKIKMLYGVYGESLKNLEVAEFGLRDQTPVIQPIDLPIPPIKPEDGSILKAMIISCILGGFISSVFIIGRKIIRDSLAEN